MMNFIGALKNTSKTELSRFLFSIVVFLPSFDEILLVLCHFLVFFCVFFIFHFILFIDAYSPFAIAFATFSP